MADAAWGRAIDNVDFANVDWAATENDGVFGATAEGAENGLRAVDPRDVKRAETAPMVLTIIGTEGCLCLTDDVEPQEEYRYSEEYHVLYYSKMPRDPRMLPPLTRRRHIASAKDRADRTFANASGADGEGLGAGNVGKNANRPEVTAPKSKLREYIDSFRPEWDYQRIAGDVPEFSKDQDGSRLVQRLLETPENVLPIFREVVDIFEELTTDVFGNYVMQKLFDSIPKAERAETAGSTELREAKMMSRLTECVRGNLEKYSLQMYGCRVMQKALENMAKEDCNTIIHELDNCVTECVFNQNANHVIQKIIEVCPERCQYIVDSFLPMLSELACHSYGCRVLQRTFEKCHSVQGVNIRPLLEAVLSRISEFTIHQYGNYVVQHGMLNAPDDLRHRFITELTKHLYAMSCSKFASNVAEKVVSTADEQERDQLISHLTSTTSENQRGSYLVQMMQDTYANYVVQRLLESSTDEQRLRIGELVKPHVPLINQSVYGKHLLRKMEAMRVISNDFLIQQGIDVSGPEYGGTGAGGGPHGQGPHHTGRSGQLRSRGGRGGNRGSGSAQPAPQRPMQAPPLTSSVPDQFNQLAYQQYQQYQQSNYMAAMHNAFMQMGAAAAASVPGSYGGFPPNFFPQPQMPYPASPPQLAVGFPPAQQAPNDQHSSPFFVNGGYNTPTQGSLHPTYGTSSSAPYMQADSTGTRSPFLQSPPTHALSTGPSRDMNMPGGPNYRNSNPSMKGSTHQQHSGNAKRNSGRRGFQYQEQTYTGY